MTATMPLWMLLSLAAGCAVIGYGFGVLAMWHIQDSRAARQVRQPPAGRSRSSQAGRPGYLLLTPPRGEPTEPEPWPAVPEHLWSVQRAELAALSREVDQMHAEAVRLDWRHHRR